MNEPIMIEVIYALPHEQVLHQLIVPIGTTAGQAVELSGIKEVLSGVDLSHNNIGIFGKLVRPETVLRNRDRVEIYRPLAIDPKEARRRRAQDAKTLKSKFTEAAQQQ
jgi:putative ubiquitin-RnfH superfamily antitoxin RatB of RatAB toxin-antitoxin module